MSRLATSSLPPVPSMPTLSLTALLAAPRGKPPPPLDGPATTFWFSGRVAIWQAIQAFSLQRGDTVAVPAFCCGSELQPFLHAGLTLRVYRLTRTLDPDPESFRDALRGASAALATHYFGFPADLATVRDLCRERGVPLIEDCAQSLLASTDAGWIGETADAAVFSPWKTLPMPYGGALILRSGRRITPAPTPPPPALIATKTRQLLARNWHSHPYRPLRWAAAAVSGAKARLGARRQRELMNDDDAAEELVRFRPELAGVGMPQRAFRLLAAADHAEVKTLRRRRYRRIEEDIHKVPGLRPLFPSLPAGACPAFFPVVVDDPAALRRALARRRIGAKHIWPWFEPSISWKAFPYEARLKRCTLGFPVHQSLRDEELSRLVDAVRQWGMERDSHGR